MKQDSDCVNRGTVEDGSTSAREFSSPGEAKVVEDGRELVEKRGMKDGERAGGSSYPTVSDETESAACAVVGKGKARVIAEDDSSRSAQEDSTPTGQHDAQDDQRDTAANPDASNAHPSASKVLATESTRRLRKIAMRSSAGPQEPADETSFDAIVEENSATTHAPPTSHRACSDREKPSQSAQPSHTAESTTANVTTSSVQDTSDDDRTVMSDEVQKMGGSFRKPNRRVKVYVLNDDGGWDDCVTGYVRCLKKVTRDGKGTDLDLQVVNENTGLISLHYRVKKFHEALYQRQDSTIITWTERKMDANGRGFTQSPTDEMALSFAEASGCKEVWDAINKAQAQSMSADALCHQRRGSGGHNTFIVGPSGALLDEELDISAAGALNWANRTVEESSCADVSLNLLVSSTRGADIYAENEATTAALEFTLPEPAHAHLFTLATVFGEQGPLHITPVRQCVVTEFLMKKYIPRLVEIFHQCEDLRDIDGLRHLFCIFRGVCFLGDTAILDECLTDKNFEHIVGALEYDPDHLPSIPNDGPAKDAALEKLIPVERNRNQLRKRPAFRSVVDIEEQHILTKIHQNYRLMFIRDVVLPHAVDDISISFFQGYLHMNNMDIIRYFISNRRPLEHLFEQFLTHMQGGNSDSRANKSQGDMTASDKRSSNDLCTLLRFVMELLTLTRYAQHSERVCILARLLSKGLLNVVSFALHKPELLIQYVATDIILELTKTEFGLTRLHRFVIGEDLKVESVSRKIEESLREAGGESSISTHEGETESSFDAEKTWSSGRDAGKVGNEAMKSRRSPAEESKQADPFRKALDSGPSTRTSDLLQHLFGIVCDEEDTGLVLQSSEIIRQVSNSEAVTATPEKELFMNFLYSKCIPRLLRPLRIETGSKSTGDSGASAPLCSNLSYICDLLSFFISAHTYRAQYFVLGNDLVGRVLKHLKHPIGDVRLSAVRLLRATVGVKSDTYDRYLTENHLLKPVIDLFVENNYRDNITNSAVLELVAFCTQEHRELLLSVLVEEHGSELEPSTKHSPVVLKARETLEALRSNESLPSPDQTHVVSHIPRGSVQGSYAQNDTLTVFPVPDEDEDYFSNSDVTDILNDKTTDSHSRRVSLGSANPFSSNISLPPYEDPSVFEDSSLAQRGVRTDDFRELHTGGEDTSTSSSVRGKGRRLSLSMNKDALESMDETLALESPSSRVVLDSKHYSKSHEGNSASRISKRPRLWEESDEKSVNVKSGETRATKQAEASVPFAAEDEEVVSPTKRRRMSGDGATNELTTPNISKTPEASMLRESSSHEVRMQSRMTAALAET